MKTIRLVQEWGVVSPDDNDVNHCGPDRETAVDEVRYLHDEGLDTAKLVSRWVSDWTDETDNDRTPPSFDPAWDKSPEEIARIQALPNISRLSDR